MTPALLILYSTIALDAVGIGLVFPILPALLQQVSGTADVAPWLGLMAALYASMQFVCAPVLGVLSDRLGRRPVLLLSLAGGTLNYLFLAFSPSLGGLLLGRAIAGLTSANAAVATAWLTDLTPPAERARRFGLLNAMFGAGFILGPVLGGSLGHWGVRLPFMAAAALSAMTLLLALAGLPAGRPAAAAATGEAGPRLTLALFNPLTPLRWLRQAPALWPLALLFFGFSATGEAYGTCWALWGSERFHWSPLWVGLSLGAFGLCQALAQALLPGLAVRRLGERGAIALGMGAAMAALLVMAAAGQGWMVFAVMPMFALGGLGAPALQALATRQVGEAEQGQLQGLLTAVVSLASVIAPLGFTTIYGAVHAGGPGRVWLAVAGLYLLMLPLVARLGGGPVSVPGAADVAPAR